MSLTNLFRQRFVTSARHGVEEAADLDPLDHQGLKGTLREIVVGKIFQPVLPPDVRIATGKIAASDGGMSSQIDLILYAPNILPPALYDDKQGFVPAESALYTIEVKSRLTGEGLNQAIDNARSVRSLKLLPTTHWIVTGDADSPIKKINSGTPYPINALFAFDSDLSGTTKSEIDRYRERDLAADSSPSLQVICVVGKGYWYNKRNGGWSYCPPTPNLNELMSFLGGLTNTLPELILRKGNPPFGMYLGPGIDFIDV